MTEHLDNCSVCGGTSFKMQQIIWPELQKQWELNEIELAYINRQQGHCCSRCGSNMRSRLLASALLSAYGCKKYFRDFARESVLSGKKILEINKAGDLHPYLAEHPLHQLVEYPQFDMMNLELPSACYDIIIHADTLEHVPDPVQGLRECFRVLKVGGRCFFTIPIIVDRPSRSRVGLPDSYHDNPECTSDDLKVHTEFGYDCWRMGFIAGFSCVKIHALEYPTALAFELEKDGN
jgi:SAM-dependent methyltransferase